jgi:hypothetical protein
MSEDELKSAAISVLSGLSLNRKLYVLSLLAHNLTISGRSVYSERSDDNETTEKLYTLNEVQHRLSSQLMHIASNDGNAQLDDAFIDSLYSFARQGGCEGELTSALKFTLSAKGG